MSLRIKTMYILAGVIAITFILLVTVGRSLWMDRYTYLEEYYMRVNMERVNNSLDKGLEDLVNNCQDWAAWDDTYKYVLDQNKDYYISNITVSSFAAKSFDFMVLTNTEGQPVIAEQYDQENKRLRPLSPSLQKLITSDDPLLNIQNINRQFKGILMLPEGPAMIASLPVTTSNHEGPVRGTMLVGRHLDSAYINKLASLTYTDIKIFSMTGEHAASFPDVLTSKPETYSHITLVKAFNQNETSGYRVLKDVRGDPVIVMQVSVPRKMFQQGVMSFWYLLGFWGLCAGGFFMLTFIMLGRVVLRKIETLDQEVTTIGVEGDVEARVMVTGRDEVASLAQAINNMLDTIENSHWQAMAQEKEYRQLFNDNIRANFVCNRQGQITLCNQAFVTMFNFGNMITASSVPISSLFSSNQVYEEYLRVLKIHGYSQDMEMVMHTYDHLPIVVVGNLFADLNAEGEIQKVTGYLFNITERKTAEERLLYLGQHDPTTGLYNRSYFENRSEAIEAERLYPLSIIVGDIDGLKLVNDTRGVDAGDALLKEAARILKESTGGNSIIARMGGDEFAILLYLDQARQIMTVAEQIRKMVADYNEANPDLPLSLSLGISRVGGDGSRLSDLYREADNYMYREKLHRSRSGRSSLVAALTSTLEARDYITEGHGERLQVLVERMARMMSLAEHHITDLKLFAQFHDIGKVGIPDQILNKPGKLTAEEWETMQGHSEIGYRIAQAAPELHHISDWILKHHEWWNGEGYPLGISGLEIPMESRMLSIADAYDAMTNDRPYRSAMSHDDVLQIIRQQAGRQFDPDLVARFLEIMADGETVALMND